MQRKEYRKGRKGIAVAVILTLLLCMGGCGNNQKPLNFETGKAREQSTPAPQLPKATPSPEIISPAEANATPTPPAEETEGNLPVTPDALQIVFLGDDDLDNFRDRTGIAWQVGRACEAGVYNLSVANTGVALNGGEPTGNDEMMSNSLVGISLMLADKVSCRPIEGTKAGATMTEMDVSNTDYFVIIYGVKDFLRGVPLTNPDSDMDVTSYVGALRVAVSTLQNLVPTATVMLCAPHYAQFFKDGSYLGDGNILKNGNGETLFDFKGISEYVAEERGIVFVNAYQDLEIDGHSAEKYLADGINLTETGRKLYADFLSRKILKYEESKNN